MGKQGASVWNKDGYSLVKLSTSNDYISKKGEESFQK